jgi:guanine deaminase
LVQTGQRTAKDGEEGERESSAEAEEEKALSGGAEDEGVFPSEREEGYNPALIIKAEDEIEKVFEKFIFSVRLCLLPASRRLADVLTLLQGDDRNLGSIFVRGRVIGGANPIVKV